MKKYILLLLSIFLLLSCGARKSQVNKTETEKEVKENTVTVTKEEVTETETKVIDATISIPAKVFEGKDFIQHIIDGKPLIYENEDIKSETYYDANTGDIKNVTTQKAKDIPVKQKEVIQRTIIRDIHENKKIEAKESTSVKNKQTERKSSYNWICWVIIGIVILWLIILFYRKYKERHLLK